MSSLKDRGAARFPLLPEAIAARYADAMARMPRIQLSKRYLSADGDLPVVGSFN